MNTIEFRCTQCGKTSASLEYKHCVYCGTPFTHTPVNIEKARQSPLYGKIAELHDEYWSGNNAHYALLSEASAFMVYHYPETIGLPILRDTIKNLILSNTQEEELKSLFHHIVLDGYFAWVGENLIAGSTVGTAHTPNSKEYMDECVRITKEVYEAWSDCVYQRKENKYISLPTANVLLHHVLSRGVHYFGAAKLLRPLDSLYFHIQAAFFEAIIFGYTLAISDKRYRV